ncbi:MAG: hypothetical protein WCK35_27540, partial [Chloroflexota bacterium]
TGFVDSFIEPKVFVLKQTPARNGVFARIIFVRPKLNRFCFISIVTQKPAGSFTVDDFLCERKLLKEADSGLRILDNNQRNYDRQTTQQILAHQPNPAQTDHELR